jgi:hypothetical protein
MGATGQRSIIRGPLKFLERINCLAGKVAHGRSRRRRVSLTVMAHEIALGELLDGYDDVGRGPASWRVGLTDLRAFGGRASTMDKP